jgi:hypothetical protein
MLSASGSFLSELSVTRPIDSNPDRGARTEILLATFCDPLVGQRDDTQPISVSETTADACDPRCRCAMTHVTWQEWLSRLARKTDDNSDDSEPTFGQASKARVNDGNSDRPHSFCTLDNASSAPRKRFGGKKTQAGAAMTPEFASNGSSTHAG